MAPSARPAGRAQAGRGTNEHRQGSGLEGLVMTNPQLAATDPQYGSFALCLLDGEGKTSWVRGWPRGRWWNAPLLFWDDFSDDGELGPEPAERNAVASLCRQRTIAPGGKAEYTFVMAWHFPNRTPSWCGWRAPKGDEDTVIGNWYTTRFRDAWEAAVYAAANLPRLEKRTRLFAATMRESTLPSAVKDAATANASTLAATTCFRTADGEFHGFEGVNDKVGCCHGNCTHVWNYETTTAHLFPSFARSLRKAAFGYSMDDAGAMHFRQSLPDGKVRSGFAATDGQMGQILHACLDWRLSGDTEWLRALWPRLRKALEFSWVANGWDADKDGVMEGVQHNTYDIEFYGPNPQCGVYYLGALRACEEMARAVDDEPFAAECRRLFEKGSRWIDANLFNGEYYIQKVRGVSKDQIAPALRSAMGADDTANPEYQMGEGCLADQLIGQYLADVAGLGPLTDRQKHPEDAGLHLPLQQPRDARRAPLRAAHLCPQRRAGAADLRLRQGGAPAHPVPLLRGGMDRDRVLDRGGNDVRGHGARGHRNLPQRAQPARWRAAQPVGRAGMRPPLRARHGGMVRRAGAERVRLRRCC